MILSDAKLCLKTNMGRSFKDNSQVVSACSFLLLIDNSSFLWPAPLLESACLFSTLDRISTTFNPRAFVLILQTTQYMPRKRNRTYSSSASVYFDFLIFPTGSFLNVGMCSDIIFTDNSDHENRIIVNWGIMGTKVWVWLPIPWTVFQSTLSRLADSCH